MKAGSEDGNNEEEEEKKKIITSPPAPTSYPHCLVILDLVQTQTWEIETMPVEAS